MSSASLLETKGNALLTPCEDDKGRDVEVVSKFFEKAKSFSKRKIHASFFFSLFLFYV